MCEAGPHSGIIGLLHPALSLISLPSGASTSSSIPAGAVEHQGKCFNIILLHPYLIL